MNKVNNTLLRSEEHTSELQSHLNLVCRLLLEKKKAENAEADAKTGHAIERSEIANFENFLVKEISHFLAAGGQAEAPFVAIQRGQLRGIVTVQVEALETRRAGEAAILFHVDFFF